MPEIENTPLNLEEIELSRLLKEHKITLNVLNMMVKQSKLNVGSVSIDTVDMMEVYVDRIKKLDVEIKVLALQNPQCLPEGVTRENFDTFVL